MNDRNINSNPINIKRYDAGKADFHTKSVPTGTEMLGLFSCPVSERVIWIFPPLYMFEVYGLVDELSLMVS